MSNPFGLFSKNWLVWRISRRHVKSIAGLARGDVLDIGCGEQPFHPLFAAGVRRVWGLEHPRGRRAGGRVDVYANALALPFRTQTFDTALCFQVLEHVEEPAALLVEARRVLKPGGSLILTAPHIWNEHEMPHDYYRFTRYGLRHLLETAGFRIVEIRPMAGYFVTASARFCYFLAHFDRWGLQILVKPAYLLVQAIGLVLDRIYCDTTESWNFLAVAQAPETNR